MKGIIFALDLIFAMLIAVGLIYILSQSTYNYYSQNMFDDQFAYDIVNVYETTGNISYVEDIYHEKGYSGAFDDISFGLCDYNIYIKNVNGYRVEYCD